MKRLISIVLSAAIALCPIFASNAACTHSYTETEVAPTCTERGYILKTCTLCGDTDKGYVSLYEERDNCYFLLEGERSGNTLNVSLTVHNNTGFWANRFTLNYNPDALEVISATKGDVWPASAGLTVNSEGDSPYIRFYGDNSTLENNTKNGLIFKVSFNIKGKMDDWGIALTARTRDNINVEAQPVPFELIDTVTVGYGDHSYDAGFIITAPTYTSEGEIRYTCTVCNHTKTETIPSITIPGDINSDKKLDSADTLLIKSYLAGIRIDQSYITKMDVNEDSKINAKDLLLVKKRILGLA
ncbi:MAG: hypothetical protein IKK26_02670 [Clostridia bacterium]|nr:hypothetical protein [Clostridia bacterium]